MRRALLVSLGLIASASLPLCVEAQEGAGSSDGSALVRQQMLLGLRDTCSKGVPELKEQLYSEYAAWEKEIADSIASDNASLDAMPAEKRDAMRKYFASVGQQAATQFDVAQKSGQAKEFCGSAIASFSGSKDSSYYDASGYDEAVGMKP